MRGGENSWNSDGLGRDFHKTAQWPHSCFLQNQSPFTGWGWTWSDAGVRSVKRKLDILMFLTREKTTRLRALRKAMWSWWNAEKAWKGGRLNGWLRASPLSAAGKHQGSVISERMFPVKTKVQMFCLCISSCFFLFLIMCIFALW